MLILGIDPGLATIGFGVVSTDGMRVVSVEYGVLETPAKVPTPQRLMMIYNGIERLIGHYEPDAIAVEELFFSRNVTTAISVGEARGVILVAAAQHTSNLYEYTPMQIKQAVTGYGKADKKQVQMMVKTLLNLKSMPKPDDAADALAVAICHAYSYRMSGEFKIQ